MPTNQSFFSDSIKLTEWSLSDVLLKNDATYPWIILVPRRANVREIYELESADRVKLLDEIVQASYILEQQFKPDKLNVAALGNVVPQLHVHVIARFTTDPAWPRPIWGVVPEAPYSVEAIEQFKQKFLQLCPTI